MLVEIEPDRYGLELSCSNRTGLICSGSVMLVSKATQSRVEKSDNEIPFQKRGQSAEQLVHIKIGRSKKLSDTERITFGSGAFQLVIVTETVPGQWCQM